MDSKKIGKTIANLRKSNHLTQTQLADKIFVSAKAISKWETGEGIPEISNLMELAKLFNVGMDYIVQGLGANGIDNLNTEHKRYNLKLKVVENKQEEDTKESLSTSKQKGTKQEPVKELDNNQNLQTDSKDKKPFKKLTMEEIMSLVGQEVKDAGKTLKKGVTKVAEVISGPTTAQDSTPPVYIDKKPTTLNKLSIWLSLVSLILVGLSFIPDTGFFIKFVLALGTFAMAITSLVGAKSTSIRILAITALILGIVSIFASVIFESSLFVFYYL